MIKVENNLNYLYNRMNWYQTDLEVIMERLAQINKKGAKNEQSGEKEEDEGRSRI